MISTASYIYEIISWTVTVTMLVLIWLFRKSLSKPRKMTHQEIVANGVIADAVILNIQETNFYVNNLPEMKFQIQIKPSKGRNFVTDIQQVIPKTIFGPLKAGSKILVKYDPRHPKEIVLFKSK